MCQMTNLQYLSVTYAGNVGVTCAPACLTSITSADLFVPATLCPSNQDIALCSIITATNIQTIASYSQWVCTTFGIASSPCGSPVWAGLTCTGNNVVSININNVALTGMIEK